MRCIKTKTKEGECVHTLFYTNKSGHIQIIRRMLLNEPYDVNAGKLICKRFGKYFYENSIAFKYSTYVAILGDVTEMLKANNVIPTDID
jgi:hypothetical protein